MRLKKKTGFSISSREIGVIHSGLYTVIEKKRFFFKPSGGFFHNNELTNGGYNVSYYKSLHTKQSKQDTIKKKSLIALLHTPKIANA